jgi:uncharacterized membrane protein
VKINGAVPIRVERRPKPRVHELLAAFIHKSFAGVVDCFLFGLLRVLDGIVIMVLSMCMPLIELTLIIILVPGVRGVVTWVRRRRPTRHRCLVGATLLGGPGNIFVLLGPLLTIRVHPGIRDIK